MNTMMMPSGSAMSMMWMRMPGQTWLDVAASFLGMWTVMMAAMMLPSLVPMLMQYRRAVGRIGEARRHALTALVGLGYFFIWTLFGAVVFPVGAALAALEMRQPTFARVAPIAVGVVVLIAASLQFTRWKARRLAWCRAPEHGRTLTTNARAAWRHGPSRDGSGDGRDHRRASRAEWCACGASDRNRRCRGRSVVDRGRGWDRKLTIKIWRHRRHCWNHGGAASQSFGISPIGAPGGAPAATMATLLILLGSSR